MFLDGGTDESLLKLAIHLSLQESKKPPVVCSACVSSLRTPSPLSSSEGNSVDVSVDSFLKSLAACDSNGRWSAQLLDSDTICFRTHPTRTGGVEDGRFEIGEIHENGGRFIRGRSDEPPDERAMRRSHSTGDLCTRVSTATAYFDSNHSQHEERPEEVARRNLRQAASAEDDRPLDSSPSINFGGQSSVEDTSDSLNADMEVCGILGATDDDSKDEDPSPLPPLPPKPRQEVFIHR